VAGEVAYPNDVLPLGLTREEMQRGYALLCQARARSDLVVRARAVASVTDVEIRTLPCRIDRAVPLSTDVLQLWLRLPAVEHLGFQAGQYLDVLLEGGRRRSFSIASPPHDAGRLELHVRRVAGGDFTRTLFERDPTGRLLRIEGPLGQFVYRESDGPVIMIAGGTGFAPLKSMLRHALERGRPRPLHLYWGARDEPDLYEARLLEDSTRVHPHFRFTGVLSAPSDASTPRRRGWVHEAVLADHPSLAGVDVYAAGPPEMVEAIRSSFPQRGMAALYFDSFDFAPK
jgi:CDP-4-dehydro-6-deoxyglucose reductase